MTHQTDHPHGEKLVHAYNTMMERVKAALDIVDKQTVATVDEGIERAKEKAVELGELTREEAEKIGDYLRRDLEDAGEYLADSGEELKQWLQFDLELIEDRLWDMFAQAADQTKLAFLQLAERAQRASQYHTGEITTLGTLQCVQCGELLHFHATGHIPPCPKCHGSVFRRGRSRR